MIVKNERLTLTRCLVGIRDAVDEIIIVDTGSTDDTRAIAARFTRKLYEFQWDDDFAAARNYSFSKAQGDYIMWLDADDAITESECKRLKAFKAELSRKSPDVVMLKYALAFSDERCTMWNYRERLLKRSAGFSWSGAVHEAITPSGRIEYSDITIEHRPIKKRLSARNLKIYEKMIGAGVELTARDEYYYGRELLTHGRYSAAAEYFEKFLARSDAWSEDKYAACILLGQCKAAVNDARGELAAYYRALEIDAPRASLCCALGKLYIDRGAYKSAEFWLNAATHCPKLDMGFVNEDDYAYTPYMWLCVCKDRLGDLAAAQRYNEMARALKPRDPSALYNAEYFKGRLQVQ